MDEFADEIEKLADNTSDISLLTEYMRRSARVTSKYGRKIKVYEEVEKANSLKNIRDDQWGNCVFRIKWTLKPG